ncbi:hypothetical protein TNCV_4015751 [Trichonephila clavipes]|nr:hypothetical protein TNCV_4015751 [Trichonephila clavipes]
MELNIDHPMPTDSRTPSRPSTPTPTAICRRHQQLTDDIQKYTLLSQGTESTLKSLTLYGKYNTEDPVMASLQNQLLEYTRIYNIAVKVSLALFLDAIYLAALFIILPIVLPLK